MFAIILIALVIFVSLVILCILERRQIEREKFLWSEEQPDCRKEEEEDDDNNEEGGKTGSGSPTLRRLMGGG